jgi:hypothetical protein
MANPAEEEEEERFFDVFPDEEETAPVLDGFLLTVDCGRTPLSEIFEHDLLSNCNLPLLLLLVVRCLERGQEKEQVVVNIIVTIKFLTTKLFCV